MPKFDLDYNGLNDTIFKTKFKLSDVKDKIEKVAFDLVRFRGDDIDQLWQVQNSDDGDYIVALYSDESEKKVATASQNPWQVVVGNSSDINIFYKGEPITRVAAQVLGIEDSELSLVNRYLPKRLAESPVLVKALLSELDPNSRQDVVARHPELA